MLLTSASVTAMGHAHKRILGCLLALLLCLTSHVCGADLSQYTNTKPDDVTSGDWTGLTALRDAWSATPNRIVNLVNWNAFVLGAPPHLCHSPGNWQGVMCLRYQVNATWVIGLELSNVELTGVLPPRISSLSKLVILTLTGNPALTGPIPKEIAQLVTLNTLDLHDNGLNGSFPTEVASLQLLELDLSGNMLSGTFPSSISKASSLEVLKISRNQFTGPIDEDVFFNMSTLRVVDLSGNNFTGPLPDFSNLTGLTQMDVSSNRFEGQFPRLNILAEIQNNLEVFNISGNLFSGETGTSFSFMTALRTIDLSYNKFTGQISDFSGLVNLTTLNLSSNQFSLWPRFKSNLSSFTNQLPPKFAVLDLSGLNISGTMTPMPDWRSMNFSVLSEFYLDKCNITGELDISALAHLSEMGEGLKVLSLKGNHITKVKTTDELIKAAKINITLQGNPYCNVHLTSEDDATRCYCWQICIITPKVSNWRVIVISTTSSAVLFMFVILGFALILRRNNAYIRVLQKRFKEADINAKRFEYNVLRDATRNFAPEMKLGAGAFGAVYKGVLTNNLVVAVKQLFLKEEEDREDFVKEVLLISNLQHRNLVTLKGYCLQGKQTLLVYEYMANLDLDKLLLSRHRFADSTSKEQVLSWKKRMIVCQGVAHGLYYLHASSQSRIVHRDIKASNILLDRNHHPKIADFGLSRPIEEDVIHTQKCAGTIGYMAPECMYGELSEKADVYSFGVLLLEIVSGRRNTDLMPEDEVFLPMPIRAWKLYKENRIMDMKDATLVLESKDEATEVQRVLETAVLCVQQDPDKRPNMFLVTAMLAGKANVDVLSSVEEYDNWTIGIPKQSDFESPLLTGTSSSSSPTIINSNSTIELRTL